MINRYAMWRLVTIVGLLASFLTGACATSKPLANPADYPFVRECWMKPEDRRMRVNAPTASQGPFRNRWEVRDEDGQTEIFIGEALEHFAAASLYLELWGGHPGVANKAFQLNDATTQSLPEVGAASGHCCYSYPNIDLSIGSLRPTTNSLTFSCEKGEAFWGHYMIDNAAIMLRAGAEHPRIRQAELESFVAGIATAKHPTEENVVLSLDVSQKDSAAIDSVSFWGWYEGYDENGNGKTLDWHGFTKDRRATATIAVLEAPPWQYPWDLRMIPDQAGPIRIKARIRFCILDDWYYETPSVDIPAIPNRSDAQVQLVRPAYLPAPFWVRDGKYQAAVLDIPRLKSEELEAASLHVNLWDGDGSNQANHPFLLNGQHVPGVKGEGHHDLLYRKIDIAPELLRKGHNVVTIHSTTHHHGLEIIAPGPCLAIRTGERMNSK